MGLFDSILDPGKDARQAANRARRQEERRQNRIRTGTQQINDTFGQFDDNFYGGIAQSYIDFARPQLDDQVGDAREKLTFDLARTGMLDSSSRVSRFGDVDKRYNLALDEVTDNARQYETETRSNVEGARADLLSMLNATGDNQAAAQGAASRAAIVSRPPSYSPLTQMFSDFTSGLSQQAALERSAALGSPVKPRFNTGLFGAPRNAVSVG
jgi:hypothetical protein